MTVTPIPVPEDPLEIFERVQAEPFPCLLESALPHPEFGRRTIVAWNPVRVLLFENDRLTLYEGGASRSLREDPFEALEHLVARSPRDGGVIGWIGYDLNRFVERVPQRGRRAVAMPEMFLGQYDRAVCVDGGRAWEVHPSKGEGAAMTSRAYANRFGGPCEREVFTGSPVSNFTRSGYLGAVERAKEYILAGDVYEVCLSQRFSLEARVAAAGLYRRLRGVSPSWYAAVIGLGTRCLVSSSPEEFLHVRDRRVRTRPIKGTRPRGRTPEEDEALGRELLESPKDDAELAMIVDLCRNDLGRVCEFGSVRVTAPKTLERHATVHHLSATIEGRLREDAGLAGLLRAVFPGGSVTGAPKIRAMEIIDELEPDRRGVYCGALGCFGFGGGVTLSMVIRTALFDGARLHFQVGGAVVADSDPESEYRETLDKARGFHLALQGRGR